MINREESIWLTKSLLFPHHLKFFQPVEEATSIQPMEIQVEPPPPEVFPTSKRLEALDNFYKVCLATARYPGKVESVNALSQSPVATIYSKFTIARNSGGQRIDPAIEVSQHLVDRVKKKRACKDFHLRGNCRGKPCEFNHGVLERQELDGLRQYARQRPCRYESKCLNAYCYWGHMCPWGPSCYPPRCNFRDMHVADFQVTHYVRQRE